MITRTKWTSSLLLLWLVACGESPEDWPARTEAVAPVPPMRAIEGAVFPPPALDCDSSVSFARNPESGSEAGFVATRSGRMFYAYHRHTGSDPDAPLLVIANGGGATMRVLFAGGTGPSTVVWENALLPEPRPNEASWTRFAHLLYIEYPGSGFSYLLEGAPWPSNRMIVATEIAQLVLTFLECRMDRPDRVVALVGESAAGAHLPLILWHLHHPDGGGRSLGGNWTDTDQAAFEALVRGHLERVAEGRGEAEHEPTPERIARQFFGQFLIQGGLPDWHDMLDRQWATEIGEQEYPLRQANLSDGNLHPGIERSAEIFLDPAESEVMFGVRIDSIPWMHPSARADAAPKHGAVPTYLDEALGPLSDGDAYHGGTVGFSPEFGESLNPLFVESVRWTSTMMTDALRDRTVLSPAFGELLEEDGLIAAHRVREGWLDLELPDGARVSLRNPRLDAVHTISLDRPRELAQVLEEWSRQVRGSAR